MGSIFEVGWGGRSFAPQIQHFILFSIEYPLQYYGLIIGLFVGKAVENGIYFGFDCLELAEEFLSTPFDSEVLFAL